MKKIIISSILLFLFSCSSEEQAIDSYSVFFKVEEDGEKLLRGSSKLSPYEFYYMEKTLTQHNWKYGISIDSLILIRNLHVSNIRDMKSLNDVWRSSMQRKDFGDLPKKKE